MRVGSVFFCPRFIMAMSSACREWDGLRRRYGAKRVLAAGVTVWSTAMFVTGFAESFAALLALRVMLGIGESVAFPCASKVLAQAVEVSRLGLANGILSFGYLVGPAVGTLIGGDLMTVIGWRPVFIIFGALSLLWLWAVAASGDRPLAADHPADHRPPSYSQILTQRALWGASWATSHRTMGITSSPRGCRSILLGRALLDGIDGRDCVVGVSPERLSALLMGWLADRWITAGRSPTRVYKRDHGDKSHRRHRVHGGDGPCCRPRALSPVCMCSRFSAASLTRGYLQSRKSSPGLWPPVAGWACRMPQAMLRA